MLFMFKRHNEIYYKFFLFFSWFLDKSITFQLVLPKVKNKKIFLCQLCFCDLNNEIFKFNIFQNIVGRCSAE